MVMIIRIGIKMVMIIIMVMLMRIGIKTIMFIGIGI